MSKCIVGVVVRCAHTLRTIFLVTVPCKREEWQKRRKRWEILVMEVTLTMLITALKMKTVLTWIMSDHQSHYSRHSGCFICSKMTMTMICRRELSLDFRQRGKPLGTTDAEKKILHASQDWRSTCLRMQHHFRCFQNSLLRSFSCIL